MRTLKLIAVTAYVGIALTIAGCGSSAGNQSISSGEGGTVRFSVQWPSTSKAMSRLVPQAAQCVVVSASAPGNQAVPLTVGSQTGLSLTIQRPSSGQDISSVLITNLPVTSLSFTANAFPGANGTGVSEASGSVKVSVNSIATASVSLTMDSTVQTVSVTSDTSTILAGANVVVSAVAKDKSGNVVLVAPKAWKWTASDASATVSGSGTDNTASVHGVSSGAVSINASYVEPTQPVTGSIAINIVSNQINYADFHDVSGLQLNGDCKSVSNLLRLVPSGTWLSGSAWVKSKVAVSKGFDTTFSFQITDPIETVADGLVFVVQNSSPTALGSDGGSIGYGGVAGSAISDSLAVEFDDYPNISSLYPLVNDPDANHISIHTRGSGSNSENENYSIGRTTTIPNFADGKVHTARILYVPGSLKVFLDNMATPALNVVYTFENGGKYLTGSAAPGLALDSGTAWVGFTSSTGLYAANHDVLNWTLSSTP